MSILVTMVALSAWLAISNHCALGATAPETKPVENECPFHAKERAPAKRKPASDSPCCKILRAIATTPAKSAIVDLAHVDLLFAAFIVVAPSTISFQCGTLDTSPPGKTCFAELIRSIFARSSPRVHKTQFQFQQQHEKQIFNFNRGDNDLRDEDFFRSSKPSSKLVAASRTYAKICLPDAS